MAYVVLLNFLLNTLSFVTAPKIVATKKLPFKLRIYYYLNSRLKGSLY